MDSSKNEAAFTKWFSTRSDLLASSLAELIAIDTTTPNENASAEWLISRFAQAACVVEHVQAPGNITEHESFVDPIHFGVKHASDPAFLRFRFGSGHARTICFNAHVDVVPADEQGFRPSVTLTTVTGRGAVDTKGNILMLSAALEFLHSYDIDPTFDVVVDLVPREEVGGSGTLAAVLAGWPEDVHAAVVLEPTSLVPHPGHRGCLTVEAEFSGRAAHMASAAGTGIDAITLGVEYISRLRVLETSLASEAARHPGFAGAAGTGRINVGLVQGGEWHGSVPKRCVVGANIGYVPPRTLESVAKEIEEIGHSVCDDRDGQVKFSYKGLRNEAYIEDGEEPIVRLMLDRLSAPGRRTDGLALGWGASCDAHLVSRLANVPTVVFGCGDLAQAHSDIETLVIADLAEGAKRLVSLLTTATR